MCEHLKEVQDGSFEQKRILSLFWARFLCSNAEMLKRCRTFLVLESRYNGGPDTFAPLDVEKIMRSLLRRMNCDFIASSQVTLTGLTQKGKRPYTVQQMSYVI